MVIYKLRSGQTRMKLDSIVPIATIKIPPIRMAARSSIQLLKRRSLNITNPYLRCSEIRCSSRLQQLCNHIFLAPAVIENFDANISNPLADRSTRLTAVIYGRPGQISEILRSVDYVIFSPVILWLWQHVGCLISLLSKPG